MNKTRRIVCIATFAIFACNIVSCANTENLSTEKANTETSAEISTSQMSQEGSKKTKDYTPENKINIEYSDFDLTEIKDVSDATEVNLSDVKENIYTISKGGSYLLKGKFNGSINVDVGDSEKVILILEDLEIESSKEAPINILSADKVLILSKGANSIDDKREISGDAKGGAIDSESAITFGGEGSININSSYNNGIDGDKNVKFISGEINIDSLNNGIKADTYAVFKDAFVNISADGNGIKVDDEDEDKGYVYVEGGSLQINSYEDGIDSSNYVYVTGGDINILTTGPVEHSSKNNGMKFSREFGTSESINTNTSDRYVNAKGIKAGISIDISGGNIYLDTTDHGIKCDGDIIITDSDIFIRTDNSKGIKAEKDVIINSGNINIENASEGIESKENMEINGGTVRVMCEDDGINAIGDFVVNGGDIAIAANGDGVDTNGDLILNGGNMIIFSAEHGGESMLDFGESHENVFEVNGGEVFAAGIGDMQENFASSSKQNSIIWRLDRESTGGVIIRDENGNELLNSGTDRRFDVILFSSEKLEVGKTYTLSVEGKDFEIEMSDAHTVNFSGGMKEMGPKNGQQPPSRP